MMHKVHRKAMMSALSRPADHDEKHTFQEKVDAIKRKHGYSDKRARKIVGAMVKKMEK